MPPLTLEQSAEVNRLLYEDRIEHKRVAMEMQGAYGRWLIASLLLVHGGAFVFLAQGEEFGQNILATTHWWFVSGLLLALVCGFVTWINWSLHWSYMEETSAMMIHDTGAWPKDATKWQARWISITFSIPILTGLASALCILGAAFWASGRLA